MPLYIWVVPFLREHFPDHWLGPNKLGERSMLDFLHTNSWMALLSVHFYSWVTKQICMHCSFCVGIFFYNEYFFVWVQNSYIVVNTVVCILAEFWHKYLANIDQPIILVIRPVLGLHPDFISWLFPAGKHQKSQTRRVEGTPKVHQRYTAMRHVTL